MNKDKDPWAKHRRECPECHRLYVKRGEWHKICSLCADKQSSDNDFQDNMDRSDGCGLGMKPDLF